MLIRSFDLVLPGMDIEEVSLSFLRRPRENGMPTLRSFIRINDWPRVDDFFKNARSLSVEDRENFNGWNMVEPSALMRPTTGVLDISWFLTRKQCFLLSSLNGYWMLLGFGSKMWYQFSDENHPFLSMFGIIFDPTQDGSHWIALLAQLESLYLVIS